MAVTVGELKALLEFIDDDVSIIKVDSEYGYELAEFAEFRFITRNGNWIDMADVDAPVTTEVGLVIW